eukprot:5519077-Pyramimonas_sp.AAC.1
MRACADYPGEGSRPDECRAILQAGAFERCLTKRVTCRKSRKHMWHSVPVAMLLGDRDDLCTLPTCE